ncbi:MAG: MobV family relaxase [Clostridium sp.]|uniref:MobV family relaxase n=1 Tax=Clostridium sp. TaxID=1506 RepID=UPI002F936CDD
MSYSVFRIQGIKTTGDLVGISKHNKDRVSHTNQDIDTSKSKDNIILIECNNYNSKFNDIVAPMKQEHTERMKTMRADRIKTFNQHINSSKNDVAFEMVFTSDNEFFDGLNRNDIKKWAEKSLDFVTKDLGIERRNILHAIVHMDEKTPHLHVVAVPLVKTYNKKQNKDVWSISRRQYINGKSQLSKAQDIYNQRMNEGGYELDRGKKGSSKEHTTKAQYIDKLLSENKELKRQNKELRAGVPKDNLKIWDNNNKLHNENELLKIQKEAMFEYIKEKGLGEEAQIIVNKKIRQKTNNKIKDKEWQQEL